MKIYFNSDFTITKREYEEYFLGSEYHNKIEVYFPMISYPDYTYIYPVFNVKRPDNRKFGEFALTEYNVENDYIVWTADLPAKALEVEGTLEITIIFKYSTDNKYAKVSTGKVLLNVKEAVIGEENDVIFTGSGDNLQGEIDAIRNEFGVRFNNVETRYISDLSELNNYKTPGIYKISLDNLSVFHLFVYGYENEFSQIRSSSSGYYSREYDNGVWSEWSYRNYAFTDRLKTINGESIVGNGDIVIKGGNVDLSDYLKNNDNKPDANIFAVYNSFNIYGKNYARGITIQENNTGIFDNNLSIYLRNNDVSINNKSFNELYRKVQNIYGLYIDFNIDDAISYYKLVPNGVATYGNINKVGGMSYKSTNLCPQENARPTSDGYFNTTQGTFGEIISGKTYTLSIKYNSTVNTTKNIRLRTLDKNNGSNLGEITTISLTKGTRVSKTFVAQATGLIEFSGDSFGANDTLTEITLNKGSTDLGYIEYFNGIRHSKVANISHTSGNLLQLSDVAETTKNGGTLSLTNGTIKLNGTFTAYSEFVITLPNPITFKAGVSYSFNMFPSKNEGSWGLRFRTADNTNIISFTNQNNTSYDFKVNVDTVCTKILVYSNNATYSNLTISPMVIRSTTAPTTFKPYAVYKNIDLSNYQTLEGYGVGINDTCYNYLDFNKNVFVKQIGSYTFTGNENKENATNLGNYDLYQVYAANFPSMKASAEAIMADFDYVKSQTEDSQHFYVGANKAVFICIPAGSNFATFMNGKTLYYELETPTETPISEIDTIIEVEQGDVITFENEYQNAVPSEIEYQVKAGN